MIQVIRKEEDDQRQFHVTVEIPEQDAQKEMRKMARKLSREMRFPGFRPGKVPYPIILGRLGEDTLRAETLEGMMDTLFQQVREELEEEPFLQAEVSELELNPMQITFLFPLSPVVQLGDYRALREDVAAVTVTDEEIDAILQDIRERHSVVETVERAADFDDLIALTGTGTLLQESGEPGETIFDVEEQDVLLDNNRLIFGGEFVTHLIGASAGDEKQFTMPLPDGFEPAEHAGKQAQFNLTIVSVKERELPEINDELAQEEGEYETLDELRQSLRDNLFQYKSEQARSDRLTKMLDNLLANGTLIYPPASVRHELDHMIEELKEQVKRSGWEWEAYIAEVYSGEDELRESMHDRAVAQLKRGLVLRQFVAEELLKVHPHELEARAKKQLEGVDEKMLPFLLEYLTQGRGSESIANEVIMDKVHERIEAILGGNAPDLEALRAAAEAEEEE